MESQYRWSYMLLSFVAVMITQQANNTLRSEMATTYSEWAHNSPRHRITFLPDNDIALAGGWPFCGPGEILRWDRFNGTSKSICKDPKADLWLYSFSLDGRLIATGSPGGVLRIWDVSSFPAKQMSTLGTGSTYTRAAVFSSDRKLLATGGIKEVSLWNLLNYKYIGTIFGFTSDDISDVAFSPDCKMIAVADHNVVTLWEVNSRSMRLRFKVSQDRNVTLAFAPNGLLLATAGGPTDCSIRIWDLTTGMTIATCLGHKELINNIAFTKDGTHIISGSADETARLWEVANGKQVAILCKHDKFIQGVAVSSDGKLIATCDDKYVKVQPFPVRLMRMPGKPIASLITKLRLSEKRIQAAWVDLANGDAAKAFQAITDLIKSQDQAIVFLTERIDPASQPSEDQLKELLRDLDSDVFMTRENANNKLASLEERAESALRAKLNDNIPLDMRRRIKALLDRIDKRVLSSDNLRVWRAIEVLEGIGTEGAVRVLQKIAKGAPNSCLSKEAGEALQRMAVHD